MKRFKFTLAALLRVKESFKKQQQMELMQIEQALVNLRSQRVALDGEYESKSARAGELLAEGTTSVRILGYSNYYKVLFDRMKLKDEEIRVKGEERAECQQKLVQTMKEVKILEKLREQQYERYLKEVAQEQEKEIGDFVSYNVTASR